MIDSITDSGSAATLERVMQFASARHRLIANNLANLSTPNFQPMDVSPAEFQGALRGAIDSRRDGPAAESASLAPESTREIEFAPDHIALHPSPISENILFHDGNDRSVEGLMQDLVENFLTFRQAAELWRSRMDTLNLAIRERF